MERQKEKLARPFWVDVLALYERLSLEERERFCLAIAEDCNIALSNEVFRCDQRKARLQVLADRRPSLDNGKPRKRK